MKLEKKVLIFTFVTAFLTLATQVLVHRIISVKLLNNYAFLVISLTMLGFAFSGILLTRYLKIFNEKLNESVFICTTLFIVSLVLCMYVFYNIPLDSQYVPSQEQFIKNFLVYMPLAFLWAIPFLFCGLILGAFLSSERFVVRKIYFIDLIGSSLGAVLVLPMISFIGVENSILFLSFIFLIIGVALFLPRKPLFYIMLIASLFLLLGTSLFKNKLFTMNYPAQSMLYNSDVEFVLWDPIARIEISGFNQDTLPESRYPSLVGSNLEFFKLFKKTLTQNNYAYTFALEYDGNPKSLKGIEETIYSAAYQVDATKNPKVLIIGVGGGFDVLASIYFNSSSITGVEINQATIDILKYHYKDYFKNMVNDPRVNIINAEGRHYLTNSNEKYDIIQLSGVDTYVGTAAAANIFSENYLYTKEAMKLYFSKLSQNGIINLMRLEYLPPREMLRALTTAMISLYDLGIQDPAKHVVTLTDRTRRNFTSLLIKKTPFTEKDIQNLMAWVGSNRFIGLSSCPQFPGNKFIKPTINTNYQLFQTSGNHKMLKDLMATYPFNIQPVTDDNPFFFRYSYWSHLFDNSLSLRGSVPVMEISLIILLSIVLVIASIFLYIPLRMLYRKVSSLPNIWRHALFLASIAIGFMAVEIGMMQKFGLFLGHPNYAISIILSTILFATGIGSILSDWLIGRLRYVKNVSYLLATLLFLESIFLLPNLSNMVGLPFFVRATIAVLAIFPVGLLLGVYMPTVLTLIKKVSPSHVPWAWGVNGIFSVIAPLFCIWVSMSFGITSLLLTAVVIYLIAGFIFKTQDAGE